MVNSSNRTNFLHCLLLCLQLLQTLRSLDLSNCSGLEADALLQILKSCNHLCKLTLPHRARGVQSTGQEFLEVLW